MAKDDRTRWDRRYRAQSPSSNPTAVPLLAEHQHRLPSVGRALDVAGGAGRNGVFLAQRGLETTVLDISPVGLALARHTARANGLDLRTSVVDLEEDPLPDGPWDVIVVTNYLQRPLMQRIGSALRPGGLFFFSQPTRLNLARRPHPSARFLLEPGEAATLAPDLHIEHHDEIWRSNGRHEAWLVARAAS